MKNKVQESCAMHTYRKTDREVDAIDGYAKSCNFLQLLHIDYLEMSTITHEYHRSALSYNASIKNLDDI